MVGLVLVVSKRVSSGEESVTIITEHASNANEEILVPVLSPSDDLLGAWVAVRYDERIYPGIIMSMTTEVVEVKAMQFVGSNRYSVAPA